MLIQKLRLKRGWSQQHLAEASGLSVRTIQRLESGHPASLESLKSLAAVFQVDVAALTEEQHMANQAEAIVSAEEEAFAYVRRLKAFYLHFGQYLVTVILLAAFNLVLTPDHLWFQWVILGWGVGVLAHGLSVFTPGKLFSPEWEKRQVEKRLGRPL